MFRFLGLSLLLASAASATYFQDCGSVGSDVVLEVENCDIPPCILERGTVLGINIQFTASRASSSLEIDATASIGGVSVPWPGVDTNACVQLEETSNPCPFAAASRVDWSMGAEVLSIYPAISTVVTFALRDETGEAQACTALPVTIV